MLDEVSNLFTDSSTDSRIGLRISFPMLPLSGGLIDWVLSSGGGEKPVESVRSRRYMVTRVEMKSHNPGKKNIHRGHVKWIDRGKKK